MADKKSVLRTSLDDPNAESIARLAVTPQITPQAQYALTDAASDSQFVRGLRTGAAGLSAGNYANTALSQEAAGDPEWKIARDLALKTQAEAQGYAPRVQSLRDIGGLNDAYDYATGALGQGVVSMAPTIGGALVGSVGGPVGRYLGGAYAGYGVERGEAALNQYADPVLAATDVAERNRAASGKALVNTALEAFVPAGVAKTLTRAPVKGAARRIENDLVTEGLTETGQEVVGYGAEKYLDPNRQLDPMDLADAFAGGALTGAGVSAGAHGASHAMKAAADKLTAEAPPVAPTNKPVAKTPVQERDFVADTFSKMSEVAKSAATPEEYLDRSFGNGNEDNAIRDLRSDTEDPGILNAADPEAALLDRDARRKERSAVYAAELLEDPSTPQVIKERITAIGDDFSDPDAQNFVAQSLVELRKNQRITDTVNSLVDTPDIEAPTESGVKKNLQDTSPTEQAAFNKLIFDSLTDEAKANETVRQRLPDLANKLLAYAARTGELTPQDMKTLSRVRDGFDLFADPDATAAKLLEYTGVPRDSNSFLERIKQATNAQTDIKKPNSFLYTSLSGAAKDTLTPRQMQQVAKLVDEVTLSDKKRGDDIVESLTPVFGSRENVNAVLDYYWQQNKSNTKYDPNETLVDGDTGEEAKFESGMHEQEDTPEASYHFAYAKGRRPFRAFVGEQINEGGMRRRVRESTKAALTLRNASPNNSRIRPIKMSEYVRETGRNPLDEMKRVRADIEGLIKEQKSHKREDRSKQIAEHEGTLSLMKDAYQKNGGGEKGASAALDLFEVLKVEGQEKNDLVTTDEELAKMATSAKAADAKETHIVFKQKNGKKLLLSAESMWKTQGTKEGSGRGEAVPSRAKRLFSEALASVLARPDIAGLETPLENIKIDRAMNLWAQPKVDPLKTAVRRDTLKNIKGDINLVEGGLDSLVNDYEAGVDRGEIRQGLEANIDYIRSELKRVSEAPMSVAAKTKARTHLKKRLELYSEAKSALDAIDYEEEFDARDADRKGMVSGQVEPGEKLGKNALPHTPMNLQLGSADPRYAEEDTGLAIGSEPRRINRQNPKDLKPAVQKPEAVKPRAEPTISKDLDKTNAVKDSFNAMVKAGQAVLRDGVYYLNDASATKYMAGTRAGVIYVNMGKLREQGLSNYVGNSPQKRKVFEQLGITPEAFDTVLGNTRRKAAFLRDHERSHLANRDADKYPRAADGTLDLMHKDAIAMELRATKDALSNEELSKMQKLSTTTITSKQSAMDVEGQQDNETDKAAILAEIERIRGKDIKVAFSRFAAGSGSGSYANYYNSVGKRQRIIRIAVNAVNPMGVAWHESLHDFFAMLDSEEVGRGIKKDLADAANAPHVKNKLRELLKDHPAAREQIEKDPEERAAYMYQFWAEGLLSLGNTGTDIFSRIQRLFADLLGVITSTQRAEDLLTALHEGRFADLSTAGEVINSLKGDRLSNKLNKAFPKLSDAMHRLYKTAPDRLRAFQNSHLNELADMFDSDWGSLGFIQRRFQQQGIWENKMLETLEGTTSAERRAALENLQAMKAPVSELEKRIAKFMDDIHQYQVEAGVATHEFIEDPETGKTSTKWTPLRQVKNYFPRNWDRSAVERDRAGFVALLQREGNLDSEAANKLADEIVLGPGKEDLEESELALGFTPFAPSSQARVLTFITPANAEKFAAYQTKDLALVLNDYVRQTAHRAEYARMFGNDGWEIVNKVRKSGISNATKLKEIGTIIQALEGTIENNLSPKMKEFMFGVMSLQNLVVLPLAVVSQMVDPIVLAARTGDLRDAGRAYVTAIKRLVGKEVDGEELSLMLGTISQDSVLDAMGVAYGATYGNKHIRKLNHWFFKLNGMQSFNTSMRIAATVAGERYLIANKNNALALSEVGLKPNDIKVNADGRLNVESTKMQLAMFKFVDQAVLRPSAGNRPVWMSDPRFMLVAHLKQFTFALHNVILKRASRELVAGNHRPWGILMLAMPVMLAADIAKFSFMGTLPPGWGYTDYVVHAIERSGLLGVSDFGIQALQDAGRGRMIGESLLGPSFEHLMMILRALSGEGGVQEVVERTVPGARFVI